MACSRAQRKPNPIPPTEIVVEHIRPAGVRQRLSQAIDILLSASVRATNKTPGPKSAMAGSESEPDSPGK